MIRVRVRKKGTALIIIESFFSSHFTETRPKLEVGERPWLAMGKI